MSLIIPKSQMTEEDIKLQFITPALQAKWPLNLITMETKITDGRINLQGNKVSREKAKKADYILYINAGNPIAVVEAKDNNHSVSFGLQQAVTYAKMLDVKFAYSSNGDGFEELDLITGEERTIGMDEFPTPDELFERYKSEMAITPAEELAIKQPYYSSATLYPPRYYQRVAVNRTVDAIAKGQDRLLLVMATGTGKTYTAFQIVYRLLQSDMKQKILYLADRNNLVDQTISGDFSPLEKVIHKINFNKDDKTTITSHQVYFSLYQQLAGNKNEEDDENADEVVARYSKLFSPDFFDLIIVDECHRGSAKEDSNWRKVLEYFSTATQIGMTATPKESETVSNIDYFGDPVYTYSLKQGIEDGFDLTVGGTPTIIARVLTDHLYAVFTQRTVVPFEEQSHVKKQFGLGRVLDAESGIQFVLRCECYSSTHIEHTVDISAVVLVEQRIGLCVVSCRVILELCALTLDLRRCHDVVAFMVAECVLVSVVVTHAETGVVLEVWVVDLRFFRPFNETAKPVVPQRPRYRCEYTEIWDDHAGRTNVSRQM